MRLYIYNYIYTHVYIGFIVATITITMNSKNNHSQAAFAEPAMAEKAVKVELVSTGRLKGLGGVESSSWPVGNRQSDQ